MILALYRLCKELLAHLRFCVVFLMILEKDHGSEKMSSFMLLPRSWPNPKKNVQELNNRSNHRWAHFSFFSRGFQSETNFWGKSDRNWKCHKKSKPENVRKKEKRASVRNWKCQKLKVSESQNWKVPEKAKTGKCQKPKVSEKDKTGKCQNSGMA